MLNNEEADMARITVEDCLQKVDNRFALIHLAAKRVRQLRKGAEPLVVCKNKDTVTALREIAAGSILQTKTITQARIDDSADIPFFIPISGEEDSEEMKMDADEAKPDDMSDSVEDSEPDSGREEDPV